MSNVMRKVMQFPVGIQTSKTAVGAHDIPNKAQVEAIAAGLSNVKEAVTVATLANVDLATTGLHVEDGYQLLEGDRVLVVNQTDPLEDGIYIASASAWVRAEDADEQSELQPLTHVGILYGDHAGRTYKLGNATAPVVGTDAQDWVVTSSSSNAAADITVEDTDFYIVSGTTVQDALSNVDSTLTTFEEHYDQLLGTGEGHLGTFTGSTIGLNANVKDALQALETKVEAVDEIYDDNRYESASTTLATGVAGTFNHALGERWLSSVKVYDATTGEDITATVTVIATNANNITVQNDDTDIDVIVVARA